MTQPRSEPAQPIEPARRREPDEAARERQEALLDEALEETFPASDPIAPKIIV